jgi:NAD/NADP transhydrogenase alpha subunit
MDRVPRITRAQKVDALSAMANAAGYRAVVEAVRIIRGSSPDRRRRREQSIRQRCS